MDVPNIIKKLCYNDDGDDMKSILIVLVLCFTLFSGTAKAAGTTNNKVLIIAHRGDSGYAPEHTMAAYNLAKEQGTDYIELDLGLTKDEHLIAIHDDTIDRTTLGSGLVNSLTLSEISLLNAGSWFNEKFPDKAKQEYNGLKIPTLEDVINHFGTSINYYIEIKNPEEYPGITDNLLKVLESHQLIGNNAIRGKVIIESFDRNSLKMIHKKYPNLVLIQLGDYPEEMNLAEIATYADGVGPNYSTMKKEFVENAHKNHLLVHCWTVNNETDMKKLISWGIDGFFTNYVDIGKKSQNAMITASVKDVTAPSKPVVNQINDYDKKVTGRAETSSTVTVKAGSKVLANAITKAGKFTITLKSTLKAGTKLSVTAADHAKNVSDATIEIVVDKTAPRTPTVYQMKNNDKKVTGKTEPGAKITVKYGKKVIATARAGKSGKFSAKLKSFQKAGRTLTVTAMDMSGNISTKRTIKIVNKTALKRHLR
ncbi:glycerophosphodiester phosphodiesterase family protein [Neobacillus niacini]|uniref:glycerophosphodiester phosphodiesterase family protein n=1 Tax=Neobacillus niacini TaxID=86668 RepID=UPI002857BA28|nr:glycerophosphodiester phosphodiesterase family protein [Neobacillus niacini]MDR6998849.1 glycerophosphoryl diester phosphodiesterase [Neobacillus niacini]